MRPSLGYLCRREVDLLEEAEITSGAVAGGGELQPKSGNEPHPRDLAGFRVD